jgi:hypothetical protein
MHGELKCYVQHDNESDKKNAIFFMREYSSKINARNIIVSLH